MCHVKKTIRAFCVCWQQHIFKKKNCDRLMFTTSSFFSFFLTTEYKHLGTEETSFWTFGIELLTHFCLILLGF